jgi:hypothetical protein
MRQAFQSISANRQAQNRRHNDSQGRLCPATRSDVKGAGDHRGEDAPGPHVGAGQKARFHAVRSAFTKAGAKVGRVAGMALVSALACVLVSGCIVEEHHPYEAALDTEIQFDQVQNTGSCGNDPAHFQWTVTNRQTGDQGTAQCAQPVLFQNLAPNATYTFDVTGYEGSKVCWQGSCNVDTRYGTLTYADCSGQIEHLCGF